MSNSDEYVTPIIVKKRTEDYGSITIEENVEHSHGLTKREYFAAKAMQGMLSNNGMYDIINDTSAKALAEDSLLIAGAILKELE